MLPDTAPAEGPVTTEAPKVAPQPAVARIQRYWWVTIGIIVLDQVTKALVDASLGLYDSSTVIPGLVDLVHVRNEGVAFGLLNNTDLPYNTALTTLLAVAALAGIALYSRQLRP